MSAVVHSGMRFAPMHPVPFEKLRDHVGAPIGAQAIEIKGIVVARNDFHPDAGQQWITVYEIHDLREDPGFAVFRWPDPGQG